MVNVSFLPFPILLASASEVNANVVTSLINVPSAPHRALDEEFVGAASR